MTLVIRHDKTIEPATVKCPSCRKGKITVTAKTLTTEGWRTEEPVVMNCIWCGGTGRQTVAQKKSQDDYAALWCGCKGEPDDSFFSYGRCPRCSMSKEHAHCNQCQKITQIG